MHRRLHKLKMIFSFALLVGLLVIALELMNWLPSIIDKESLRKYETIESVKRKLHIEKIYVPVYLPEELNLRWPPSEIYAQKKPFVIIVMHFQRRDSKEIGLVIHQIDAKSDYHPEPALKPVRVKKESKVMIGNREGILTSAVCENDIPCTRVLWKEGDFLLTVIGEDSVRDIIRIARSMAPEP